MLQLAAARQKVKSHASLAAPIMLALMASVVLLLGANALSFHANLVSSRAASSDNRVWTTSQLEVDHKNLLLSLNDGMIAAAGPVAYKLVVAFDVFYSRIEVVSAALERGDLPPSLRNDLAKAVSTRDALEQKFDRLDIADPTALADFAAAVQSMAPLLRKITLESLGYFVDEANKARDREVMLWERFWLISLVLIGLMGTVLGFALLLQRQLAAQIRRVQSATNYTLMVYEASMMAVVVTDLDGKIVLFNPAAERLLGYDAAEILGRNIADTMIPPHRMDRHTRAMKRLKDGRPDVLLDGKPRFATTLDAKGGEFPIELTIHANRDTNDNTLLIAFVRDVSEQFAYESNLREARDEARRHAESRTMFLATMSHEMRTPLHGLLASLDLIDDADQSPETSRRLATARDCALRSVSQINDVLDLIQIDELQETLTAFAPAKVVAKIVSELAAVAHERSNVTQIRLTGATEAQEWMGAAKTFSRVLYNLIGNALKFTENGSVRIELTFRHDSINFHRLFVAVDDSGIGVPRDDQELVFDLFYTSQKSCAGRRQEGSGLGLSIARKGVEKMGGKLYLDSDLGRGSRFYFEIPLAGPAPQTVEEGSQPLHVQSQQFDMSCLVVDDNIVNLELTAQMLRQLGCNVDTLDDGGAAVTATVQTHYDVIFMDLNMPNGMSGREAARHIRILEQIDASRRGASCIVALTADTTFGSPSSLTESSMDHVLHKPVRTLDLVRLLTSFKGGLCQPAPTDRPDQGAVGFAELKVLMGPVAAKRLLAEVVNDLRSLKSLLGNDNDPHIEDALHRAIGSTGMVGLASLSQILSEAMQKLRKQGNLQTELSAVLIACELAIKTIQNAINGSN